MSYARQSKTSDLYIYQIAIRDEDGYDAYRCESCLLNKENKCAGQNFVGKEAIINHIKDHIKAGHKVESDVIPLIEGDN